MLASERALENEFEQIPYLQLGVVLAVNKDRISGFFSVGHMLLRSVSGIFMSIYYHKRARYARISWKFEGEMMGKVTEPDTLLLLRERRTHRKA